MTNVPHPSRSRPGWPAAGALVALAAALGCGGGGGTGQGGRGGSGAPGGMGGAGGLAGAPGTTTDGIVVDTPSGMPATESADGYCDILEAVAAADTRQSVHECANPKGSQTIVLKGGATYPTGKTLRFKTPPAPKNPTPVQFTVADGTPGMATISAAQPWLLDPGDPPTACLLHISKGALVAARRVMLTQARDASLALTGACVANGALTFREGRVTGFRESGLSATCVPSAGCNYDSHSDNPDGARVEVASSLVDNNASSTDGGGLYSVGFNATVVVNHSSFIDNTAARGGGGLYFGGGWNTNVIRASTISGNTAALGGGVMVKFECSNTYLNVFASTIADNTAQQTGGGIQFEPADLACAKQDVSVYASVIGGNHSVSSSESNINSSWWTADGFGIFGCYQGSFIYVAPGLPSAEDVDGSCVLTSRDPRLGPLTSMGGVGDLPVHPLYPGSPAIDAVTSPAAMYEDQRDGWIPDLDPPVMDAWSLFDRDADGNGDGRIAPDFGAVEMSPRWQTELLAVADKGPSAHQVVVTPSGFDRGAGTSYAAAGATHEFVTYRLPIVEPGYYDVTVGLLRTPTAGKLQVAIADGPSGPWTELGTPQDTFAGSPTFATSGPFRSPLFLTPGERLIRFTVAGKNAASSGYGLTLDYIDASRSRKACPVLQLAAGARHTCAMTASGVRCWGDNEAGQLGDGTTTAVSRAPAAEVFSDVQAVAAGARHTCALTSAGGVRCWGANDMGQLGDGTTMDRHAPPAADVLGDVAAIAAGAHHTCALTTAGGVRCWGANTFGQLGDGTTMDRATPPASDAAGGVASLSAGSAHTCV
ncbi:MAG TPA: choice-of-anchor Q domain-containing protein, partial [Polyangia bacterium]